MKKRITALLLSVICVLSVFAFPSYAAEESSTQYNEENTTSPSYDRLPGDVSLDGRVTTIDCRLILQYCAGLTRLNAQALANADVTGDGRITTRDARLLLVYIAKIIKSFDEDYDFPTRPETTTVPPTTVPPTTKPPVTTTKAPKPVTSKLIKAPIIYQYPDYPRGCELVTTTMCLQYWGFNVQPRGFIANFVDKGPTPYLSGGVWYSPDPNVQYMGNPQTDGWGMWAQGVNKSVQKFLDKYGKGRFTTHYTYSETLESLCRKYVVNDIPVIIWGTAYMAAPRAKVTMHVIGNYSKTFVWTSQDHCLLLVGFDEDYYYFNDSVTGRLEKYSKSRSNAAYNNNGHQAVIIQKVK